MYAIKLSNSLGNAHAKQPKRHANFSHILSVRYFKNQTFAKASLVRCIYGELVDLGGGGGGGGN